MTNHYPLPDHGLQAIVERVSDGVMITTAESVTDDGPEIIYVNPAMEDISGYTSRELIGKTPSAIQCKQTSTDTRRKIEQHLSNKESLSCKLLNAHKNGELYWIKLTIVPIKNPLSETTHFAFIQRVINNSGEGAVRVEGENEYENKILQDRERLLTKQAFMAAVEAEWNRAYRHHSTFSVLCIRTLNPTAKLKSDDDTYSSVGSICHRLFRKEDTFGRIAENEFAVLMPETDLQLARSVVNRLKNAVASAPQLKHCSFETGISELNLLDQDAASILTKAREYAPLD